MAARLKERFLNEITPALMQKFNYTSVMQVPKIEKVVINMGVGEAVGNAEVLDAAVEDLRPIAGQKPVITRAKKSIAGFKLARRHADRRESDAARRKDVLFPR